MRLTLLGSNNRYALDQLAIAMFPGDTHSFDDTTSADTAVCTVTRVGNTVSAHTDVVIAGKIGAGDASWCEPGDTAPAYADAQEKQLIKRSFYLAAVNATGEKPDWGCLSGVRPAKLARMKLEQGMDRGDVCRDLTENYFVRPEKASLAADLGLYAYELKQKLTVKDVSIYISIPFCPSRCTYCSFVSAAIGTSGDLIRPYIDALKREILATAEMVKNADIRIDTVYIGGGTPTTLSAGELNEVADALTQSFDLSHIREFTVEAGRADTITEEKLLAIRDMGATRLSINPQTMNDEVLRLTGRMHTVEDTVNAFYLAKSLGFHNINMDLIAGLKGDTVASFKHTIDAVCELRPSDVTVHTLALKKGADYKSYGNMTEAELGEALAYSQTTLAECGYRPYYLYRQKYNMGSFENIGYTIGEGSFYNVLMMEEIQTVLSFGAGAVTKLHTFETGQITRLSNHKYPLEYIRDIEHTISSKGKLKLYLSDL